MKKTRTEFSQAIAGLLLQLGAVQADVEARGVTSHWKTDFEASVARDKFKGMGEFAQVEKFKERNGLFAVYCKFQTI